MKKFYYLALALLTLTLVSSACSQSPQEKAMHQVEVVLNQAEELSKQYDAGKLTQDEFSQQMDKLANKLSALSALDTMKLSKEEEERYTALQERTIKVFVGAAKVIINKGTKALDADSLSIE